MRWVLLAVTLGAFCTGSFAPALAQQPAVHFEALSAENRAIIREWLERDCSVAASQQELSRLRAVGPAVQEVLIEAYNQGPTPDLERAYVAAFTEAFSARNAVLTREGARLFGPDETARLQSTDRESYVQRRLGAARLKYRTNAVLGLGIIGSRSALPLLDQVAAEQGNPLQEAARMAARMLRESASPPDQQRR